MELAVSSPTESHLGESSLSRPHSLSYGQIKGSKVNIMPIRAFLIDNGVIFAHRLSLIQLNLKLPVAYDLAV